MSPESGLSDAEALRRVVAGHLPALGELYDRHAGLAYGLALRITGDASDAEEVVQDVFVHVWRQAGRYDTGRASVAGWVLMLTRSRAIDRLRSRQARPPLNARDLGWTPAVPINQERAVLTSEWLTRVNQELSALPDPQRQAIELAYYEGLTHREMAERLNEPLGTIKTRVRTALQRLRAALTDRREP